MHKRYTVLLVQVWGKLAKRAHGRACGRAHSEACSGHNDHNDSSNRSEHNDQAPHFHRETVIPVPPQDETGTSHIHPPLVRVTLAARHPNLAWQQKVAPAPTAWHGTSLQSRRLQWRLRGCKGHCAMHSPAPLM